MAEAAAAGDDHQRGRNDDGEIDEGAWYVLRGEPADAFAADPGRLWRTVLRRQGGELAMVATYPDDPNAN